MHPPVVVVVVLEVQVVEFGVGLDKCPPLMNVPEVQCRWVEVAVILPGRVVESGVVFVHEVLVVDHGLSVRRILPRVHLGLKRVEGVRQ